MVNLDREIVNEAVVRLDALGERKHAGSACA